MSYDKDHPQKATLEFSIQDNLNAVNKEKVQRELEDAQKTMNKNVGLILEFCFAKSGQHQRRI